MTEISSSIINTILVRMYCCLYEWYNELTLVFGGKDLKKIRQIFSKAGGFSLIGEYWRGHVLIFAVFEAVLLGFRKKSLEILRLSINNRLLNKLRRSYKNKIDRLVEDYSNNQFEHKSTKTIWVCWLQGIENAPDLVKICLKSLKSNLTASDIVILDSSNYKNYVNLPSFIIERHNSGQMSDAHFTDLIRLQLLITYGGTWIDSTVFCSTNKIPKFMLDSDLFLYQTLKPGADGQATTISNWFITARSHNCILTLTYNLLVDYWRHNVKTTDYFIFHDMFQLALERYPEVWKKVVPVSNEGSHALLLRLTDEYNETVYEGIMSQAGFHKLSYKIPLYDLKMGNTMLHYFIEMNG